MISRTMAVGAESVQIRRITWKELYQLRPDLRQANDNEQTPMSARRILPRFLPLEAARHRQEAAA